MIPGERAYFARVWFTYIMDSKTIQRLKNTKTVIVIGENLVLGFGLICFYSY